MMKLKSLLAAGSVAAWLVTIPAIGADSEVKSTVDKTKNPITGTVTTTKKYKKKVTDPRTGDKTAKDVTDETSVHTDGAVDHSRDATTEQTQTR